MKRVQKVAAALLGILLLSGCMAPSKQFGAGKAPPVQQIRILRFQVNGPPDGEAVAQADQFADRVEDVSGGKLVVRVIVSATDQEDLADGSTDFAILRNIQIAQVDPDFATFSLPFLYDDAAHMGVALNSEEMLERLSRHLTEEHGAAILPLAALCSGSANLLSEKKQVIMPGDFRDLTIAMYVTNTDKLAAFGALGAKVLPFPPGERLDKIRGEQKEYYPGDPEKPTETVVINTIEMEPGAPLELPEDDTPLYLINTYHTLQPLWLSVNRATWESFTAYDRAVILEAAAGMVAQSQERAHAVEEAFKSALQQRGVVEVVPERRAIANALYGQQGLGTERFPTPAYFNQKFYQFIQSFSF